MSIPKVIYQSWKTSPSTLPPRLALASKSVQNLNPSYRYEFYDDHRCRQFLEDHFGLDYVEAFDSLIPGAFRCDLWRYAVLYVHGGVYIDLDLAGLVPLNQIISSTDHPATLVTATDRRIFPHIPKNAIYQAFLACTPRHPVMKIALETSFENIKRRKKASRDSVFDITGPVVMGRAINRWWGKMELSEIKPGVSRGVKLLEFEPSGKWIVFGGVKFFEQVVGDDKPQDYYTKVNTYHPRVQEKNFPWIIFLPLVLVLVLSLRG